MPVLLDERQLSAQPKTPPFACGFDEMNGSFERWPTLGSEVKTCAAGGSKKLPPLNVGLTR